MDGRPASSHPPHRVGLLDTATASPEPVAITEDALRATFDANEALTIGLEEEVLLLDPRTHAPIPVGSEVVHIADHPSIKRELPACQIELLTRPHACVADAVAELGEARARVRRVCDDVVAVAAAAVHPIADGFAAANGADRHRHIVEAYGEVAHRQLVGALQVHVALGSADRSLAVYNALRGYLPELAALAASAPFAQGRDTGLASIRPVIAGQLPRQGVPPVIESWAAYAADLRWGVASDSVPEPRQWWWELRPHIVHGTLEVRVPDVQATIGATAAVAAVVHALVGWLAARFDEGRLLPVAPTWRIAENRWRALRDGVHGTLADLETGTSRPTAQHLHTLLDAIEDHASTGFDGARALIGANGADHLRAAGLSRATHHLVEAFRR